MGKGDAQNAVHEEKDQGASPMIKKLKRMYWRYEIRHSVKSLWSAKDFDHMNIILSDIRYARSKLDRLL